MYEPFNGIIDDLRIYNRALTAAEIQHLYQTTETKLNQTPLALFTTSATQDTAPFSVNLDASTASDADGSIVSYQWQTDTGQSASGKTATLTFPRAGTYQLTLTVTDDQGATSQAVKTMTVGTVDTSSGTSSGTSTQTTLTVQVSGSGSVTAPGITCGVTGTDCEEEYAQGTQVTLTASPDKDYEFTGWSGGGCSGTGDCVLDVNADSSVTAVFVQTGSTPTARLVNISPRSPRRMR